VDVTWTDVHRVATRPRGRNGQARATASGSTSDPAQVTSQDPDSLTGEFEPFRVDVEPARESVRVSPVGELDIATVDKLQAEVVRLRESGFNRIVLDLRQVRFIDSTGLRLVLELDAAARADSHDLEVIRGSDVVHRIFEVTQVAERLNFVEPS
jgi:anti-anti-sigma factor